MAIDAIAVAAKLRPAMRDRVRIALLMWSIALGGCAALPPLPPRAETSAISDWATSDLGRTALASLPEPTRSGFRILPVPSAAYETRLALAALAQRTLDVETFVLASDDTGRYLLGALRDAALRGVRVRLLVDDLHTEGTDPMLDAFAAFPNVEVRLFNPFPAGRDAYATKMLASLGDFGRVNHRMHNKAYIVDNAWAVFGGRNLGDEYFMRAREGNFVDLDVLAAGPVVRELSRSFDAYWNSAFAYPFGDIRAPRGSPAERRGNFDQLLAATALPPADETVPARLQKYIDAPSDLARGMVALVAGDATVYVDPVDKAAGTRVADRAGTVRAGISNEMRGADREVFVVSPYFVPGDLGMEAMTGLRARGVHLRLLTNSLAATDEPLVHAGYVRYRADMLRIGVEIFELSPGMSRHLHRLGRFGDSLGMLHAKIVVIDRRRIFIGSMNLDGRSERYNTELGVLIDSADLAQDFLAMMDYETSAYRLQLDPAGARVQWLIRDGDEVLILDEEPEASFWRRLEIQLLGPLVPEGWL